MSSTGGSGGETPPVPQARTADCPPAMQRCGPDNVDPSSASHREGRPTVPNPDLIVHSRAPYNAEPPLPRLRASFITDRTTFYVRSHGTIPVLDAATHRLRVDGLVTRPLNLSMQDLRTGFPRRSVTAVLQCAGNRRADLNRVRPVAGDPWIAGAIGNAIWIGVSLADVLRAAGVSDDARLHVALACCDEIEMPGKGAFATEPRFPSPRRCPRRCCWPSP